MESKDKIMPAGSGFDEADMAESTIFPMYKPDAKLNLDALLARTFVLSQKMMRFIHPKYDANKEIFYAKAQESDHFESRFITGARIVTCMHAIKALEIIMAAKQDVMLDEEIFQAVERAWWKTASEKMPGSYRTRKNTKNAMMGW